MHVDRGCRYSEVSPSEILIVSPDDVAAVLTSGIEIENVESKMQLAYQSHFI